MSLLELELGLAAAEQKEARDREFGAAMVANLINACSPWKLKQPATVDALLGRAVQKRRRRAGKPWDAMTAEEKTALLKKQIRVKRS